MGKRASQVFTPEAAARFANLELVARLAVEGLMTGAHHTTRRGSSIEFAEHREYTPGDDLRFLDWTVYARTDNFYIMQFEADTNSNVYILLDTSGSMGYGSGEVNKLQYGTYLAAALAYLAVKQKDRASLLAFEWDIRHFLPPSGTPAGLAAIFDLLGRLSPGGETETSKVFHDAVALLRKRSLVVVISDLFTDPDEVMRGLINFRYSNHEVIVFHLLDHDELTFPFKGFTTFEGLENDGRFDIEPRAVRKEYLRELNAFIDENRRNCRGHNIDYVLVDTSERFDSVLATYLNKRARFG